MIPVNSFITENESTMNSFLDSILIDPNLDPTNHNAEAWADCKNPPTTEDFDAEGLNRLVK